MRVGVDTFKIMSQGLSLDSPQPLCVPSCLLVSGPIATVSLGAFPGHSRIGVLVDAQVGCWEARCKRRRRRVSMILVVVSRASMISSVLSNYI